MDRLAIMVEKVAKILPSLETELGRAQEIVKTVTVEGKELFDKVKKDIIDFLEAKYEMESKRMVRISRIYVNVESFIIIISALSPI